MGDRSQIYIKYDNDKLLAIQEKYALGYDFIKGAVFYAENAISFLKGKEELMIIGEDLLDRFFFFVRDGKTDLQKYRNIFNHCNQCGKCFIEVQPDYSIKYCFTDNQKSYPAGTQKCLDWRAYLQWCGEEFDYEEYTGNKELEAQSLCENRFARYILMSEEELKAFMEFQYDMEGMYQSCLRQLYEQ